jgi:hypothetical protein
MSLSPPFDLINNHSFQCWKPYKDDAQYLKKPRNKVWLQKLDTWFASRNINRISSFVAEENILPGGPTILAATTDVDDATNNLTSFVEETTNSGCPPLTINMPDPLLVVDDNPPQQESEPAQQQPQQKPNKSITIEDKMVQVQGKDNIIWVVSKTHVVIHRNYLKRLKNKESQIDKLHQSVRKKKYYTGTPLSAKATAGISCIGIGTGSLAYGC